ncbi:hypothetical protein OSTOST_12403, partial [Ostertagia ostertagi]
MWLATLLLALAAFQTYLFSSVIRCSMYISKPGESDESTATSQKQPKRAAHVQWSTQNPSVAQVDETTTTPRPLEWATGKPIQSESVDESRGQSPSRASQQRRRSDTSRKVPC